jgi:hypothetical protein
VENTKKPPFSAFFPIIVDINKGQFADLQGCFLYVYPHLQPFANLAILWHKQAIIVFFKEYLNNEH